MREALKVALRISEVRQRLNEIGMTKGDALTPEVRSEADALATEYSELETRGRALAVAEESEAADRKIEGLPVDVEFRALVSAADLGNIVQALVEHRATSGAEKELQDEMGLGANQVPLDMIEHRLVTPAPTDVGANQAPIIPGVFPRSVAGFLGVDMPRVGVGEAVFPVLSTNAVAHTPAENAESADTTGSFTAAVLSPARIQAAFFYSREDRARFAGMGESLRENLNMALADGLDKQLLVGDDGFLGTDSPLPAITDVTAESAFADYRSLVYDATVIDGLYAYGAGDISMVLGPHAYSHAASKYRGNSADDSALDSMMRVMGGVRVSTHIPNVANKDESLVIAKGTTLRNAVAAIWDSITLIPDEITKAAHGQIVITAVMLFSVKIVRAGGFVRKEVQVEA